jgi:Domain of unknown function (DUF4112)
MQTVFNKSPLPATDVRSSMVRLQALATLMDSAFVIPGTNVRMGLDGLIGLLPVAGDLISGAISSYIVWEARKLGAPRWLIARMSINIAIDTAVGSVPFVGDVFDIAFRANMKNMALLKRYLERQGHFGFGDGYDAKVVGARLSPMS